MNDYNSFTNTNAEDLYPEAYRTLYPYVHSVINDMENQYGNIYVTDDLLNSMSDEILSRAGMADEVVSADGGYDAAPVMAYSDLSGKTVSTVSMPRFGFGRNRGFDFDHDRGRGNARDILRILLLREIFGRGKRPRWHY